MIVETLAQENFAENSPEESPTCAEEKEQAEGDFTIEVESGDEEKSVIVIDLDV